MWGLPVGGKGVMRVGVDHGEIPPPRFAGNPGKPSQSTLRPSAYLSSVHEVGVGGGAHPLGYRGNEQWFRAPYEAIRRGGACGREENLENVWTMNGNVEIELRSRRWFHELHSVLDRSVAVAKTQIPLVNDLERRR